MRSFDYIIAGAGASGLTLAYLLLGLKDKKKSFLIIDKDKKAKNDRTWCFWEKEDNLFEDIVSHTWPNASVKGQVYNEVFKLAPYRYKMIKGIDLYDHLIPIIKKHPTVTWIKDEIESIDDAGIVHTQSESFQGHLVFNSTINYDRLDFKNANTLLQHFKGWVIETETPAFKPDTVTYMDFSVDQEGDCRFIYMLPFSDKKAMVEYTLFNKNLMEDEAYETRIKAYLDQQGIRDFHILEEEKGVIPMTDYSFTIKQSEHVFNIGILGGFAKASTGYSFLRAQHILKQLVRNISNGEPLLKDLPYQKPRFKKYDATLLDILSNGKYTGEEIFTSLFAKNGAHLVFKFLDEETTMADEIRLMSTTPILDFGRSFIKQMTK